MPPAAKQPAATQPAATQPAATQPAAAGERARLAEGGRPVRARAITHWWTGWRPARRRPWWKWAAIALLLAATVTVTVVYAATLVRDIARQQWAGALDASREAVLAVVGWAAVTIVLFADGNAADGNAAAGAAQPADGGPPDSSPTGAESVLLAQQRVHRLRIRLAELAAARERAGSGIDPDVDREVATTTARLEQARQWLTSAQSALAASRSARHQAEPPASGLAGVRCPGRPCRARLPRPALPG